VAIKGSLKEASLADVCQLLALGQKTGCLSVTDRSKFGQIFFERGRITHATIVNRRDRLGDLLVRDGVLDHARLREVVDQQTREPDRRLGEILVERGWLTREQLENYIRVQVEEAVYSLFTWSRGSFFFEVDQRPPANEVQLSLNPESLLLEGARRVDEWSLIEKKIPTLDLLFEVERERLRAAEVELTEEQEQIIPLLDGTRTVHDIIDQTGLGEFDVGKALYGLIQAGFAHRVGRRAPEDTNRARHAEVVEHRNLGIAFYRTGMLEDAGREFKRVLELQPGDMSARFHLALVAVRERRDRDALRLFKGLLEEAGPSYAAFTNLAFVLNRLGRRKDALLVLREAETLRAGGAAITLLRGAIQLESGDLEAAEAAFKEYRERLADGFAPCAAYYHHVALAAAIAGRLDVAEARVQEGIDAHPTSAPLLVLAGAIAERKGDLVTAEGHYRQAAEEDPSLPQAHKNLGDLAYRRGLLDEAIEHYTRAIQIAPALGDDVYAKLGNLHYKRMEAEKALEYWHKALELNPENRVVRNNIDVATHAGG
jgi:tetratricopeptide (TPR) repeat protein